MPHHFRFSQEHRILLTVMEGNIDGTEIEIIDQEMRARIARTQPSAGISDLTAVKTFNVPNHILHKAAIREPPPFPAQTRRFIVAPSDFLYGMMRMYELIANRGEGKLMVVRRIEDALGSLGASNVRFETLE